MAEPETSPELMRAIEVLSRLPPPPKPPPGTVWTRFAAALPPDDGTVFEVRMDGDDKRWFVSWRGHYTLHGVAYPRLSHAAFYPWDGGSGCFFAHTSELGAVAADTLGWWRLLPADDPPPVPPDAA